MERHVDFHPEANLVRRYLQTQSLVITRIEGSRIQRTPATQTQPNVHLSIFMLLNLLVYLIELPTNLVTLMEQSSLKASIHGDNSLGESGCEVSL